MSLDYDFFGLVSWRLCLRVCLLMEIKRLKSHCRIRIEDCKVRCNKISCSQCSLFVSGVKEDTEDGKVRCNTVSFSQCYLFQE